jgi:hypothetical protein
VNGDRDEDPTLIRGVDGRFYVVWSSKRRGGVHLFIKSSEDGRRWNGEERVTYGEHEDYYPSLSQSRDGTFHLVWFRLERRQKNPDIWYSTSRDGRIWSDATRISRSTEPDWSPSLLEDSEGVLRVVWSSSETENRELVMARSDDRGATWSAEQQVTRSSEEDDFPQLLEPMPGRLVLVWTRYRKGSKLLSYAKDASAEIVLSRFGDGRTWSPPEVVSPEDPKNRYLDLLPFAFAGSSGELLLSWTSSRTDKHGDILLRDLAGDPGAYRRLTTETKDDYDGRIIRTARAGQYLMVWVSNREGNPAIYSRFVER